MSRRSREKFDSDVSRVFIGVMGVSIIALGISIAIFVTPASSVVSIIGSCIAFLGTIIISLSVLCGDKQVQSWAEILGNHEVIIVFLLLAYGIVWVFNRKKI